MLLKKICSIIVLVFNGYLKEYLKDFDFKKYIRIIYYELRQRLQNKIVRLCFRISYGRRRVGNSERIYLEQIQIRLNTSIVNSPRESNCKNENWKFVRLYKRKPIEDKWFSLLLQSRGHNTGKSRFYVLCIADYDSSFLFWNTTESSINTNSDNI